MERPPRQPSRAPNPTQVTNRRPPTCPSDGPWGALTWPKGRRAAGRLQRLPSRAGFHRLVREARAASPPAGGLTHTRAHPPTPGPRARALPGAHAHGYKAAGGGTVRADRADGRRGRRHPRRGTPGRQRLYLLGPAPQSPQPRGQPSPSLTRARPGRLRG